MEANAAVAAGRAEAAAAACDEASARLVRSAYGSAESAASGRPRRRVATAPPPDEVLPPQSSPRYGSVEPHRRSPHPTPAPSTATPRGSSPIISTCAAII